MYYFAYGSNMNHKQIKTRCPACKFIKRVYGENFKFVYDGYSHTREGAVANIIESKDSTVWGALFDINEDNLAALDGYEGYPNYYDRKLIKVKDDNGIIYDAITYYRLGCKVGAPHLNYRNVIIQGARDSKLPNEYISENI